MENKPRNERATSQYPVAALRPLLEQCKPPLRTYLISLGISAVGDTLNVAAAAVAPSVVTDNQTRLLIPFAIVFPFILVASILAYWLRRSAQRDRAGLLRRVIIVSRGLPIALLVIHITCACWCAKVSNRTAYVFMAIVVGGLLSAACFAARLELLRRQHARWSKIRKVHVAWTGTAVALGATFVAGQSNPARAVVVAALLVNVFVDFHDVRKFQATAHRLRDFITAATIAAASSSCGYGPSMWRTRFLRWPDARRVVPARSKTVIAFLAANPCTTRPLELDQEYAAIERELRMTSTRDFELCAKWAVSVDDMARYLMELRPDVIHVSGHGVGAGPAPPEYEGSPPNRDVACADSHSDSGIYLHAEGGEPQFVNARALAMMIKSAGIAPRLVVLNACYSQQQADELCTVVDCVVGMTGPIRDDAARTFAVGLYRALGNARSVACAVDHAVATMAAKQVPGEHRPRCHTREGIDAGQIFLVNSGERALSHVA